jgi:predicted ATPase
VQSDSAETVQEKMSQGVGAVLCDDLPGQHRSHLSGHLVGLHFSDSRQVQALLDAPQALHQQALAHVVEFFGVNTELDPTAILLEDIHWADASSLDVISHLAVALPQQRLLIVAAARPELFERRPYWGERQASRHRLELEPLTRRESRQLLDEILQKGEAVPDTLRDLVVAAAEGNPFFIEELTNTLIEDGVIVKREDAWQVRTQRAAEVRVPDSLTAVLRWNMAAMVTVR